MLEQLLVFLAPVLAVVSQKFGVIGLIFAYSVFFVAPFVSILIEIGEAVVQLSESKKDDEAIAKIKAKWLLVMKVLEVFPHVNLPLSPAILRILQIAAKVLGAVKGAIQGVKQVEEKNAKPAEEKQVEPKV